jgi:hypothetical protein
MEELKHNAYRSVEKSHKNISISDALAQSIDFCTTSLCDGNGEKVLKLATYVYRPNISLFPMPQELEVQDVNGSNVYGVAGYDGFYAMPNILPIWLQLELAHYAIGKVVDILSM